MDIHPTTILRIVDFIAMSTTDEDARSAVEEIRKLHNGGVTPSLILQQLVEDVPVVQELRTQIFDLETKLAELAEQNGHEPVDGFYTMEQFLSVLTAKMRRSYGWKTDYVRASHETAGCEPVENVMVQTWQNKNKVPVWAIKQIDLMIFNKRQGGTRNIHWSDADAEFLKQQYLFDPTQKNIHLARCCAFKFGRHIGENSIKGALDRLRRRGLLPKKRSTSAANVNQDQLLAMAESL